MKPKLQKLKRSELPAITTLAIVGALTFLGLLALPNPGPASAQAGACAEGGSGFRTTPTSGPAAPTLTAHNMALNVMLPAAVEGDSATATNGNPEYTGFGMLYRQGTSGAWTTFTGEITVNRRNLAGPARIAGLTNSQAYEVQMRVTCANTASPWSTSATGTPAATTPGSVRNLKATQVAWFTAAENVARVAAASGAATVNSPAAIIFVGWDLPADNDGSPVTSYHFKSYTGGTTTTTGSLTPIHDAATREWKNTNHPNYPTRFDDVTLDTGATAGRGDHNLQWKFEVAANNSAGAGPFTSVTIRIGRDTIPDSTTTDFSGTIASDRAASGGAPKLTVKLNNLAADLPVGSGVVLFLEDDFDVPDSIPASSIYFVANSPATVAPEIDTDAYYDDDKDDVSIAARIPDMCAGNSDACEDPNGFERGQDLTMFILGASRIRNPSEAGNHTVAFDVLRFDDTLPGRIERLMANGMERAASAGSIEKRQGLYVSTPAKISLSDTDGKRNETLTVNGSGFNNGAIATAYVAQRQDAEFAVAQWWNTLNCDSRKTEMAAGNEFCFHYTLDATEMTYTVADKNKASSDKVIARHLCEHGVIPAGTEVGSATVGSYGRVAISFEVTVPPFKPGNHNLICVADSEGRASGEDVEDFELAPSIRISPNAGRVGDEVTIFTQDFPTPGAPFMGLKVGGGVIKDGIRATSISSDGSATATFKLPPQQGVKRVDAQWGAKSEDAKVTILPAILNLNVSKNEVLPNERITLIGAGFGSGSGIMPEKITIDDVPLHLHDESDGCTATTEEVPVSSGGQFVCPVALWPADDDTSNPTLTPGRHTIRVEDKKGIPGEVEITIPEPTVKTTPDGAGPRDIVKISGANWPVDNPENLIEAITVTVTDGERMREYSVQADGSGRWSIRHQVDNSIPIPSTISIEARYDNLVRHGEYKVPSSTILVYPGEGSPGDKITLSVENMPAHSRISRIEIHGRDLMSAMPTAPPSTDRDGAVTVADVIIPGFDPGTYSILLEVNNTVAVGSLVIHYPRGLFIDTPVAVALAALGDSAGAVFYFNGLSRDWLFYDPRPEFADLNTLEVLEAGESYWLLVTDEFKNIPLGGKSRSLTCNAAGNCWNLIVW